MTAHILNCLETITRDHPNAGVILLGDFNRLHDVSLLAYPLKQVVRSPAGRRQFLTKFTQISKIGTVNTEHWQLCTYVTGL